MVEDVHGGAEAVLMENQAGDRFLSLYQARGWLSTHGLRPYHVEDVGWHTVCFDAAHRESLLGS